MTAQFEIEGIFEFKGYNSVCIFARLVNKADFELSDNSTPGNVPVKKGLTQPRAHDDKGNPRTDLYAFELKQRNDRDKLSIGETVLLNN